MLPLHIQSPHNFSHRDDGRGQLVFESMRYLDTKTIAEIPLAGADFQQLMNRGPISKDKTFFLIFYQGQRLGFSRPYKANVPRR
jgi:hypothetical protein